MPTSRQKYSSMGCVRMLLLKRGIDARSKTCFGSVYDLNDLESEDVSEGS